MPVQVDADRHGYVLTMAETPGAALDLADAAARKLVVGTRREISNLSRVIPAAAAAVLALAAALVIVAVRGNSQPRLVSDTISARGGELQVNYAFNEPVRALLLVNGKPATTFSSLRRSGELLWRDRGHATGRLAIEGVAPGGRHAVFNVSTRVPGGVHARHRGAA
jgi:hypothetical protein